MNQPAEVKQRKGGRGKPDRQYIKVQGRGMEYLVMRAGSPIIYVRKGRVFKSTFTSNKTLARAKRDEILAEGPSAPKKTRRLFSEVYKEFLDFKEPVIAHGTYKNHYVYPYEAMRETFDGLFIDDVSNAHWQDFVSDVKRKDADRGVTGYHTLLNSVVLFALTRGYIKKDPGIKLDRKKERKSEVHPWSKDEVKALLKNAEGTLLKVMTMMARRGPRVKETRLMRKAFFNFQDDVIELPGFVKVGEKMVRYTKTGKPRDIPMGKLKSLLKGWCDQAPGPFVFFDPNDSLKAITESNLRNAWEEHRDALKLKGGLYRFRHFSIVQALLKGINPATVAKIHGHDIKTLYREYSRFLKQDLNEAVRRLDD